MGLEPQRLLAVIRRWWWLILIIPVVVASTTFWYGQRQPELYSASATLLIVPSSTGSGPDYQALLGQGGLASTYQQLVTIRPVMEQAASSVNPPLSPTELQSKTTVTTATGALLRVTVTDGDPQRAADLANAISQEFIAYLDTQSSGHATQMLSQVNDQLADARAEAASIDAQITALENVSNAADPQVQEQLASLRAHRDELETSITNLLILQQSTTMDAATANSQVTIAEPATTPDSPFAPRIPLYIMLGIVAGLMLVSMIIAIAEYLDNTVKVDTDLATVVGVPRLVTIPTARRLRTAMDQLFVVHRPADRATEAIRLLRTNLHFASSDRATRSIAITSPNPGEGKSTVAANLAATWANTGVSVLLIDADLRNPTQHRIFNISNRRGLSMLLSDMQSSIANACVHVMPNLHVLPSGPMPSNPADLLTTPRLGQILNDALDWADVVLIDTPPALRASDATWVAAQAGTTLLVCRAGKTRIGTLRRSVNDLRQIGTHMIGVVVNRHSQRGLPTEDHYSKWEKSTNSASAGQSVAGVITMRTQQAPPVRMARIP